MNHFINPLLLLMLLIPLGGINDCDGEELTEDSSFDLWCRNDLCQWEVDSGEISRVTTWHRSDFGTELIGDPVSISQELDINSKHIRCLTLEIIAKRDTESDLRVAIDFLNDGSFEYDAPVESVDWEKSRLKIRTPSWYQGARLRLTKTGPGRVVLGQVRLFGKASGCGERQRTPLADRPLGAACEQDDHCEGGRCEAIATALLPVYDQEHVNACSTCDSNDECNNTAVCGLASDANGELYRSCITPALKHVGQACYAASECASNICCASLCAECCGDGDCQADQVCRSRDIVENAEDSWQGNKAQLPRQCNPAMQDRRPDEPCFSNDDCQTGLCNGTPLLRCVGTRIPCTTDDDCPGDRDQRICSPYGYDAGRCGS